MTKNCWIMITIVVSIFLCAFMMNMSHAQVRNSGLLKIQIGPISEIFVEKRGWVCDLPIQIQNIGNKSLYLPNPLDFFMNYPFRFFLLNPDKQTIRDRKMSLTPLLSKNGWIKLEAQETKEFSKHIIIINGNQFNFSDSTQEERLNDVIFILRGKIFKNYVLYGKVLYNKPFRDWEQEWLKMQQKAADELEFSKFWHGKIESNHLELDFSNAIEKTK